MPGALAQERTKRDTTVVNITRDWNDTIEVSCHGSLVAHSAPLKQLVQGYTEKYFRSPHFHLQLVFKPPRPHPHSRLPTLPCRTTKDPLRAG